MMQKIIQYRTKDLSALISIAYQDQGAGRVICMLPSLARSGRDYDVVAAHLVEEGYRVIRPDPRGFGASVGPLENLNLHDFAADVAAVLDHEKTRPVLVVGHAWGSQPARMLAADRPELVAGVVMAAASAGKLLPGATEKPYSRMRAEIDGSSDFSLSREARLDCLSKAFFAPGHDPSEWLDGWSQASHHAQSHARIVTPIDEYFAAGDRVPILDLQAEFDAVVVPNIMKPLLGDRVTVQVIRNAGHALAPEQPRAMSDAIADFARLVFGSP
jgi:pimeloyl-ACP methyl ester carboxylesterase